jgi:hypothetical protein
LKKGNFQIFQRKYRKYEKFRKDRRQKTDDRWQVMAIAYMDLWSVWTKNICKYTIYCVVHLHENISLKIDLFSPWNSWKIADLALNNNHSLTHENNNNIWIYFLFYFYQILTTFNMLKITLQELSNHLQTLNL